jgi:hypothetical protein
MRFALTSGMLGNDADREESLHGQIVCIRG